MIRPYKKKDFYGLLEFVISNSHPDFFITENNTRKIVKDGDSLRKLLKQASNTRIIDDFGDIKGILIVWKSLGVPPRYYIKMLSKGKNEAKDLLTSLLWEERNELFVKIKKDSSYLKVFNNKGFKFLGDRGSEILLRYKSMNPPLQPRSKDDYE
jgi:hypothetical protein